MGKGHPVKGNNKKGQFRALYAKGILHSSGKGKGRRTSYNKGASGSVIGGKTAHLQSGGAKVDHSGTRAARVAAGRKVASQHAPEIEKARAAIGVKRGVEARQTAIVLRNRAETQRHAPNGGDIGGIRSASARQRAHSMNRADSAAKQTVHDYQKRREAMTAIAHARSRVQQRRKFGNPDGLAVAHATKAASHFDSLKAGDKVRVGNNVVQIAKKNRKSIVTVNGVKYTAAEVAALR